MTNEQKLEQYKKEIEAVFLTEKAINYLNRRDNIIYEGNKEDLELMDRTNLGKFHKTYFIKVEVKKEDPLNDFFMRWLYSNLEIAGLRVTEISWDTIKHYSSEELKNKLKEEFNNIINKL
jgi:hypothetical protein